MHACMQCMYEYVCVYMCICPYLNMCISETFKLIIILNGIYSLITLVLSFGVSNSLHTNEFLQNKSSSIKFYVCILIQFLRKKSEKCDAINDIVWLIAVKFVSLSEVFQ